MYTKITISGKICTGKSSVFRELTKKLPDWPVFSSGALFREYANTHSLSLNNAQEQTERLTHHIDGKARNLLKQPGHLLLDAWLGGMLAEGIPNVMKVLLIADDETRFVRFAEREGVSLDKAKAEVLQRDKSWFDKVANIYGRSDFFDKSKFDLVIDTSHTPVDQIIIKILHVLRTTP